MSSAGHFIRQEAEMLCWCGRPGQMARRRAEPYFTAQDHADNDLRLGRGQSSLDDSATVA